MPGAQSSPGLMSYRMMKIQIASQNDAGETQPTGIGDSPPNAFECWDGFLFFKLWSTHD
jgi:hypothetical protein